MCEVEYRVRCVKKICVLAWKPEALPITPKQAGQVRTILAEREREMAKSHRRERWLRCCERYLFPLVTLILTAVFAYRWHFDALFATWILAHCAIEFARAFSERVEEARAGLEANFMFTISCCGVLDDRRYGSYEIIGVTTKPVVETVLA